MTLPGADRAPVAEPIAGPVLGLVGAALAGILVFLWPSRLAEDDDIDPRENKHRFVRPRGPNLVNSCPLTDRKLYEISKNPKDRNYYDGTGYPNSIFRDKSQHPDAALADLNKQLTEEREASRGGGILAEQNREANRANKLYIRTGKLTFEGLDELDAYSRGVGGPDSGLRELREQYKQGKITDAELDRRFPG